jgi:histidyl-tRNA synthetase
LGLDRLLAAMETLQMIPATKTTADVLIVQFESQRLNDYLKIAAALRRGGIGVVVYPDAKKLAQQLKYADRHSFRAVIVAGANEFEKNQVLIKWMADGVQTDVALSEDAAEILDCLRARI